MIFGNSIHISTTVKPINKKNKTIFGLIFLVCLTAGIYFGIRYVLVQKQQPKLEVIEVKGGWGYEIKIKQKVLIYQPYIPVINGERPFPNKESAEQVGKLVLKRLTHKAHFAVTEEDLRFLTNQDK